MNITSSRPVALEMFGVLVVEEQAVRWNVKDSIDTDLTLRAFLGSQGMKKGNLSRLIEDAVSAVACFSARSKTFASAMLAPTRPRSGACVGEAVSEVRAGRPAKKHAEKS